MLLGLLSAAFVIGALAGAILIGRNAAKKPELKFQRLTFKRGTITGARFAPDGRTVVYSAGWDGASPSVYSIRLDALDSVSSGYAGANLLAVSMKGQLALSLKEGLSYVFFPRGTLALAPFAGGTPRELNPDVAFADFSKDGEKLAVIRATGEGSMPHLTTQVEYPVGTALYRSSSFLSHARISPSGEHVAFLGHSGPGDDGYVFVVDRSGKIIVRKGPFSTLEGLAWSPRGDEVWFGGDPEGNRMNLRAVSLDGRERLLLPSAVSMCPHDVAPDGRVLVSTFDYRTRLFYRGEATPSEREISVQADSWIPTISPDGSWIAFGDGSLGATQVYLRSATGAPPVSLGPGVPMRFAQDGRTLVVVQRQPPAVVLHPVGAGQSESIRLDGFEVLQSGLLPGGKSVWFSGNVPSRPPRLWEAAASGGAPRPLTPEGVSGWVTDDGASVVFFQKGSQWIQPIGGGEARPVEGVLGGERVAAWAADGKPLFVFRWPECPVKIYRLDPKTGRREFFREIGPADSAGVLFVNPRLTTDGKTCVYGVQLWLSELHVIEGLR